MKRKSLTPGVSSGHRPKDSVRNNADRCLYDQEVKQHALRIGQESSSIFDPEHPPFQRICLCDYLRELEEERDGLRPTDQVPSARNT